MTTHDSLLDILTTLDCVALKRVSATQFEMLNRNTPWFEVLVPESSQSERLSLSRYSAFLSDFILDAEDFWRDHRSGSIESGYWTEKVDARTLRLEAIASSHNGQSYLIILCVQQRFDHRQQTLQLARELVLSNEEILAEQEQLHQRINSLLADYEHDKEALGAVRTAISNLDQGVIITNPSRQALEQNQAAFELIGLAPEETDKQLPIQQLTTLLQDQYPEFQSILSNQQEWHGEVFWYKPPDHSRWLIIGYYRVPAEISAQGYDVFLVKDITRLKYLVQHNEKLSIQDNVTKLVNRKGLWQALEQNVVKQKPFSLLCLDIKQFKRTNEVIGHVRGDQILMQLAERLNGLIGNGETLARMGGDEFAIICFESQDSDNASKLAAQISEVIAVPFYTDRHEKVQLSLSIGGASYPQDASQPEDLIVAADLAMFEAKKQSRTTYTPYTQQIKAASERSLEIEGALREALEMQQFELYLQPIISLDTNQVVKAEALLRWRRSNGQYTPPDQFIGIAEQSGLIIPIGRWVISEACEVLKRLHKTQPKLILSINLSPRQIADRDIYTFIKSCIEQHQVNPECLEIELTEGVLVDDYERVKTLFKQLRGLGLKIAIDDFGTGYSSLAYLKKLPIDNIKIDRSFVKDLEQNENDRAIVLAVIAIARSLKLGVIAEGVETTQQKQFLQTENCDLVQGYLYGPAVNFDEFSNSWMPK